MIVRQANPADADAGSMVLRRSITELCAADHASDPAHLARWLANKTPQVWLAWLQQADSSLYVAEEDGRITGVGMLHHAGSVLLNYVSPDARFKGVSKALLARMEADAMAAGARCMTLESTRTACPFYRSAGYAPVGDGGMTLRKQLGAVA